MPAQARACASALCVGGGAAGRRARQASVPLAIALRGAASSPERFAPASTPVKHGKVSPKSCPQPVTPTMPLGSSACSGAATEVMFGAQLSRSVARDQPVNPAGSVVEAVSRQSIADARHTTITARMASIESIDRHASSAASSVSRNRTLEATATCTHEPGGFQGNTSFLLLRENTPVTVSANPST